VKPYLVAVCGLLAAALAACVERTPAPTEPGVCWHVVLKKDQEPRFNRLARSVKSLEYCGANLEAMRQKFRNLGGGAEEIVGAYQGRFLFIRRAGVYTASSLEGNQYLVMVRTGDGRLAIPGAMRQAAPATAPAAAEQK
jgi:hypothetical protein